MDNSDNKIDKSIDLNQLFPQNSPEVVQLQEQWQNVGNKSKNEDFISSIYRQRYKLTPELAENVKKLRLLAQKYPRELINVFIYIFRP